MAVSVQLTKGKIALIDDEDAAIVTAHVWRAQKTRTARENWYAYSRIDGRKMYLHRFLTNLKEGDVDHEDGDGLNNKRSNLRPCTRSQNSANAIRTAGASGYIGVHFYSRRRKFRASIWKLRVRIHIGWFTVAEDAARARDAAQLEAYGKFAQLNFPLSEAA